MRKNFSFLLTCLGCIVVVSADAAVQIQKAPTVATQKTTAVDSTSSLINTALNLYGTVQQLNVKQKELSDSCVPSSSELSFVNKMMKEWAKTGSMRAEDAINRLKAQKCSGSYDASVRLAAQTKMTDMCVETFSGAADRDMIWQDYPKASIATYCPDGSQSCPKDKKTVSNIYDVFNLIDFQESDYKADELTMARKLMTKIEECSNAKLSAKKRQMWQSFLKESMGNMGSNYNTSSVLETVESVINSSGGGKGKASAIGGFVTQFIDK